MPIPKDILSVKRPRNTVVIAYGKNKQLFAVRQRVGCENRNGRHVPINGPTIGHIINNEYVPIDNEAPVPVSQAPVDIKDWADIILCDELFKDVQDELLKVYDTKDAMKIYNIAILRVCQHGIKDSELKAAYETSFLSELYPNVALSRNTVSTFLNDLGKAYSRIQTFMKNRADNVRMDDHLLIDGTLKTDNSIVNSLSDFSRKARLKGTRDISILYAFDLESMEPVCSKCYPGNMLDETAYEDFIKENGIKKGIIVGDKGFPESCADEEFRTNPDLHYLNPIKRNSTLIEAHHLHDYTGILSCDDKVTYRKEKSVYQGRTKWLYSFRDARSAAAEEQAWLANAKKTKTYSLKVLHDKQKIFGTIVLECDLDMDPETAYKAYSKRWEIEIFMRYYKTACDFDDTRVQDDYSVIGSEFCDFLATLLTCRLVKKFDSVHLLDDMTYKKVMEILDRAKKARIDNNWQLIRITVTQTAVLQNLGLLPKPEEPPKKKRGRPKKSAV